MKIQAYCHQCSSSDFKEITKDYWGKYSYTCGKCGMRNFANSLDLKVIVNEEGDE